MSIFSKQIFTGFMPQLHTEDVISSFFSLLPWNQRSLHSGPANLELESKLKNFFQCASAMCFDSGRNALFVAFQALGIKPGDEILVQAFTCAVVSNAILWTGATPVYVDIDDTYNADPRDIEKKITKKTKVILVQHTFGIPAHLHEILALAQKHNIALIEDCAHVLGGTYQGKLLGTFGDIAMLSFGSEKPISCGRGGALITHSEILAKKIQQIEQTLSFAPNHIVRKQLRTNIYFWLFKPLYKWGIGKLALSVLKHFQFLSRIIDETEKKGKNLPFYPSKLSNSLAKIALLQFSKLDSINEKRIRFGQQYTKALQKYSFDGLQNFASDIAFLRFPLRIQNPKKLLFYAKKRGVLLGDWYSSPIAPTDVDPTLMGYVPQSCPNAEKISKQTVNLPTQDSLSDSDIHKIIEIVQTYVRKNC